MKTIALLAALCLIGCGERDRESSTSTTTESRKTWTREEFREMVIGKTKEEVIEILGRPAQTIEVTDMITFVYRDTTYDTISQKIDYQSHVIFENGIATRVVF